MDKNEPELISTQMLKDAIKDSELLLSYASEQGLIVDSNYIKAIIKAKKNEQKSSWNEQDEIDFWIAFQTLSKIVQPVTIDSLRAASVPIDKPLTWWDKITLRKSRSMVSRSVTWYRWLGLIFMIIMLTLQIYGIIGTALMAKVTSGNTRIIDIAQRKSELILITQSATEDRTAAMEMTNLELENDEIAKEVESSIQLLGDWLNLIPSLWSRTTKDISKSVVQSEIGVPGQDTFTGGTSQTSNNIVIISQAKSLIIILNQYILPLLYGLLGGFAFVLRSLADETKKMIYTSASNIKFGLRIHLGALAGLVIGFLWGDFQGKSFGLVESLSPLAVAFLAGYSVDFLFRMLDSIIGNVVKKEAAIAETDKK